MEQKLTAKRLEKQELSLQKEPISGVIVTRDNHLNFHFLLHALEGQYQGGFYHGLLELHQNYPFAPPKLKFYTPNGRFEVDQYICTSFTNFHKETWSVVWNVRSLILATISFWYANQVGRGGIRLGKDSPDKRKQLAQKSLQNNLKSQLFKTLFEQKLKKAGLIKPTIEEEALEEKEFTIDDLAEEMPLISDFSEIPFQKIESGAENNIEIEQELTRNKTTDLKQNIVKNDEEDTLQRKVQRFKKEIRKKQLDHYFNKVRDHHSIKRSQETPEQTNSQNKQIKMNDLPTGLVEYEQME